MGMISFKVFQHISIRGVMMYSTSSLFLLLIYFPMYIRLDALKKILCEREMGVQGHPPRKLSCTRLGVVDQEAELTKEPKK